MVAELLLDERHIFDEHSFAELVIWRIPQPIIGSAHQFKYRLAFVVDRVCVIRYDNEFGKGDHRHVGATEQHYEFTTPEQLLNDFEHSIARWRQQHADRDI